jgi:hypothetical protein
VQKMYKLLERYWLANPAWMPFLIVIMSPILLSLKPGMAGDLVGTKVDLTHTVTVDGEFLRQMSGYHPYVFREASGAVLSLACEANERTYECLDQHSVFHSNVSLTYAPVNSSVFRWTDGIIVQVQRGQDVIVPRQLRLDQIAQIYHYGFAMTLLFLIVDAVFYTFFSVMAVFIGVGIITSIKRGFGGFHG